jgi:uncharacterized protein YndB with AHSA1/START domain
MTERSVVHNTFTLERHYACSRERVFSAWADSEAKARWFAGGNSDYQLDFRVGGIERNSNEHGGKRITWEALYRDIVPAERIVYSALLFDGDITATMSQATVELVAEEGGTMLVLTEQGAYLDGHELPEWREEGTGEWLDALGRYVTADVATPR